MGKSQDLYKKAKTIIPGGTQLLSKRPEMFLPDFWPAYHEKAKGCEVWDLDGNKYIDASFMGIGACVLGYADEDVNKAVNNVIENGNMTTLNPKEEVELAELLISIHPWADMARFARCGGEAMAIAMRIARAASGKDKILFCGYHGWHDWYLASNLADDKALDGHLLPGLNPLGVPRNLKGSCYPFLYNNPQSFLELVEKHKDSIGVIVMESVRNDKPNKEFLDAINKVKKELNIVLVIDEITAGFRLNAGGAHLLFDCEPDIAVFAKGISNGFPMAAVIGKKAIMEVAQDTFISSTYWTERIGPVAAIATIKKIIKNNVTDHLCIIGKKVQDNWNILAQKHNLKIHVGGLYPLSHFSFEYEEPLVYKTLFTQFMLDKGFLATTSFYVSYAHKNEIVDKYLAAVDEVFKKISEIILEGNPKKHLKGPVCHGGFKRLT
jgi:glutamate-1-semialdehyde aminotransferase